MWLTAAIPSAASKTFHEPSLCLADEHESFGPIAVAVDAAFGHKRLGPSVGVEIRNFQPSRHARGGDCIIAAQSILCPSM